jgi:hypothetical protein
VLLHTPAQDAGPHTHTYVNQDGRTSSSVSHPTDLLRGHLSRAHHGTQDGVRASVLFVARVTGPFSPAATSSSATRCVYSALLSSHSRSLSTHQRTRGCRGHVSSCCARACDQSKRAVQANGYFGALFFDTTMGAHTHTHSLTSTRVLTALHRRSTRPSSPLTKMVTVAR